ncbi:unnamed protein product, partial [Effrenium voratum]
CHPPGGENGRKRGGGGGGGSFNECYACGEQRPQVWPFGAGLPQQGQGRLQRN